MWDVEGVLGVGWVFIVVGFRVWDIHGCEVFIGVR